MEDFIKLVKKMRETQKNYFTARKRNDSLMTGILITDSKSLERQVDAFIEKYEQEKTQPKLF